MLASVCHCPGGKVDDVLSIPATSARVERLFSQCKIMLNDRRNRLQIDGLEAAKCIKSWNKLEIGLPQVVVAGTVAEAVP